MPEGERLPEQLSGTPMRLGWPPDATTLRQRHENSDFVFSMPPRLLEGSLLDQPWPRHSLRARLINLDYATWVPPASPAESEMLYIVDDYKIRRNDRKFALGALQVALINIGLLAGEFYLSNDEIDYLIGYGNPKLIRESRYLFEGRVGTDLFEKKYASMGREHLMRLNQKLRFIDLRPENKKGIPEFIG
jgi:hypothetical protein